MVYSFKRLSCRSKYGNGDARAGDRVCCQRLQTSHREEWAYNIQTTSKLDSFARYEMSKHLSHIANPMHRTMLAKIRTTNHSLEIELGRHRNILRMDRVCRICKTGLVETELHFLLECSAYEDLRQQLLFCEIAFVDPPFLYLSQEQAFRYLMSDQLSAEPYCRVGYYTSCFMVGGTLLFQTYRPLQPFKIYPNPAGPFFRSGRGLGMRLSDFHTLLKCMPIIIIYDPHEQLVEQFTIPLYSVRAHLVWELLSC